MDTPPGKPSKFDVKLDKLKARLSRKQSSASMSPSTKVAPRPLDESYDLCDSPVQPHDSAAVKHQTPMRPPRRVSSMAHVRTPSRQPDIWEEASTPQSDPNRVVPSSSRRSMDVPRRSMLSNDEDKIRRFLRNLPMPAAESSGSRPPSVRSLSIRRPLADAEDEELDEYVRQLSTSRPSSIRSMRLGSRCSMSSLRRMDSVNESNDSPLASQEIGISAHDHDATLRPPRRQPNDRVSLSSSILVSTPTAMNSPSPARSPDTPTDYVGKWTHRISDLHKSTQLQTPPPMPLSPALSTRSTSNLDVPKELRLSLGRDPDEERVDGDEDADVDAESESSLDVLLRAEARRQGPNALTRRNVEALDAAMEASLMAEFVPTNVGEKEVVGGTKGEDELEVNDGRNFDDELKIKKELNVSFEVQMDDVLGLSSLSFVPSNVWDDGAKVVKEMKIDGQQKVDDELKMAEKPKVDDQEKVDAELKVDDEPELGDPKLEEGPKMTEELKMNEERKTDEPKVDEGPQTNENKAMGPKPAGNAKVQELGIMPATTVSVHVPTQDRPQPLTVMKPKTLIDQPPPSTPTSKWDVARIVFLMVYGTLLVGTIVMIFCNFGDHDMYHSLPEFLVMHGPGLLVVICAVHECLRCVWMEMTAGEREVEEE